MASERPFSAKMQLVWILVLPVVLGNMDWLEKMVGDVTEKPTEPPEEAKNGCGHSFNPPSRWRVVRGNLAHPGMFPWLAPLYRGSAGHICSANILSRRWLLTAAHCINNTDPYLFHVQPGDHDISSFSETNEKQRLFKVRKWYVHPDYIGESDSYKHDLALLELTSDLLWNDKVQPICFPKRKQNIEGSGNCFVAGWGATLGSVRASLNTTMHYLNENVRNWQKCKNIWKHHLDRNHICYGNGDPTPCNGDSGGGLMCRDGRSWRLAGIASWVWEGCDKKGFPGVFIDVSKYLKWIEKITGLEV